MSIYDGFDSIKNRNTITKRFIDDNADLFDKLMGVVQWANSIQEAVYCCRNEIQEMPICSLPDCNERTNFYRKYTQFCCKSHSLLDKKRQVSQYNEKVLEKRFLTNNKRYGGKSPFSSNDIQNKAKQTCKERYGFIHPTKNEDVKLKLIETNNRKYGSASPFSDESVKEKRRKTLLERYNVENHYEIEGIYDKILSTMIDRYGDHNLVAECFQESIRKTFNEKYGCDYTLQSDKLKNKGLETLKKKYSIDYEISSSTQIEEVLSKALQSSFRRKEFITEDNKTISIMGYEGYAYNYLLSCGITNIEWCVEKIQSIRYFIGKTPKLYKPDLYADGVYYEVKSIYTLKTAGDKYFYIYDYIQAPFIILVYSERPDKVKDTKPTVINNKEELKFYIEHHIK